MFFLFFISFLLVCTSLVSSSSPLGNERNQVDVKISFESVQEFSDKVDMMRQEKRGKNFVCRELTFADGQYVAILTSRRMRFYEEDLPLKSFFKSLMWSRLGEEGVKRLLTSFLNTVPNHQKIILAALDELHQDIKLQAWSQTSRQVQPTPSGRVIQRQRYCCPTLCGVFTFIYFWVRCLGGLFAVLMCIFYDPRYCYILLALIVNCWGSLLYERLRRMD